MDEAGRVLLDASAEFTIVARTAIERLDELLAHHQLSPARHAALTAQLRPAVGEAPTRRAAGLRVLDGGR